MSTFLGSFRRSLTAPIVWHSLRRFLRFIGFGIAGLVALVVLAIAGLYLLSELSRPR